MYVTESYLYDGLYVVLEPRRASNREQRLRQFERQRSKPCSWVRVRHVFILATATTHTATILYYTSRFREVYNYSIYAATKGGLG